MRILVISNLYPPNAIGGYERLCFEVAGALADFGHEVSVLTSDYGGGAEDYRGQTIERSLKLLASEGNVYEPYKGTTEERAVINLNNVKVLERRIAAVNPDVVFVWNLYFFDPSLLDAIRRLDRKVVFLLTDNWMISFLNAPFISRYFAESVYQDVSLVRKIYLLFKKNMTRLAVTEFLFSSAIFPSKFMRELYLEAGFAFGSDSIIYHGVHLLGHGREAYVDRGRMIAEGEIRLLFAGRVVDVKGLHTVVEALPEIISKTASDLDVCLTVIGDVQDQQYMQRVQGIIKQHKLEDNVVFGSSVPEKELFELFQDYDIYVFPSLYEPFSLTLIHALSSGIPTVASDAGGNREIVHHRKTGLLFNKGDAGMLATAVLDLVHDDMLRKSVSLAARTMAGQYTFERMIAEVESVLRKTG